MLLKFTTSKRYYSDTPAREKKQVLIDMPSGKFWIGLEHEELKVNGLPQKVWDAHPELAPLADQQVP